MASHKISIPNLSLSIAAQLLASPGLVSTPQDLFRAGQMLDGELGGIEFKGQRNANGNPANPDEFTAWADDFTEIEITERQRDTLKSYVKAACEKSAIGASKYLLKLMSALGMNPEE